jgi:membrane protein required for beta-lactamase induction
MNIMQLLKVQNYFNVLILLTVLLTNQAMGQNNVKKSLDEYRGTWSGTTKQSLEQMQKQKVSF